MIQIYVNDALPVLGLYVDGLTPDEDPRRSHWKLSETLGIGYDGEYLVEEAEFDNIDIGHYGLGSEARFQFTCDVLRGSPSLRAQRYLSRRLGAD